MQDYLIGLNEPQKEAVLHVDGPLMIIAGSGEAGQPGWRGKRGREARGRRRRVARQGRD